MAISFRTYGKNHDFRADQKPDLGKQLSSIVAVYHRKTGIRVTVSKLKTVYTTYEQQVALCKLANNHNSLARALDAHFSPKTS